MAKHEEKDKGFKKIVTILLVVIFVALTILYIRIKWTEFIENKMQREVSDLLDTIEISDQDVPEGRTKREMQVEILHQKNSDIKGWIQIDGTNINYPVLQGKDNDYYLKHNYKYDYISTGSIFLDKDFDFTIPSSNLLIYGHRNKVGLMFDELIKYEDESFYKGHKTIRFTTDTEDAEYEVMSAFYSRVYYTDEKDVFRYYYFVNANNEKEYNDFVNNSKKASIYDTGITANYGEQLMTLSTCDYSQENGRFAVVAKKVH